MSEKKSKDVEFRRDSAENWEKAKNYTPSFGTIVIYDFDDNSMKIKVGDGKRNVNELPFLYEPRLEDSSLVL